jgi:hypothetical protein
MDEDLETHYRTVAREILAGRVIPFLGAGVNIYERAPHSEDSWEPGESLPSGADLAKYLATNFDYPLTDLENLAGVAQYAAIMTGSGPLYEELRRLLDRDYEPTSVHRLLAAIPGSLRSKHSLSLSQLIITTNYDDVLERAFEEQEEPFDLVWYMAEGDNRGKFLHRPPAGEPIVIDKPNEFREVSPDVRTVILKMHGAVDRIDPDQDSYVITEDHYIDYLTHTDISGLVPVTLAAKLRRSHFLFLGYSLRDWNLRVILHRIWGEQKLTYKSWAVQFKPQPIEMEYWAKRDVDIFRVPLAQYIEALRSRIDEASLLDEIP